MTSDQDRIAGLLIELRDGQRQLLEEYRRVAGESLALQRQAFEGQQRALEQQRQAVAAQARYGRFARVVVLVLLPVVLFVLWLIVRLSGRVLG